MLLSLSLGLANAQQFAGIATYKSDSKLEIQLDDTDRASGVDNDEVQKALRKALQKDYELHFNQKESIWKEVESLGGAPEVASGGMRIAIKANNGVLYKNIQEQQSLEENDVFGKEFLVEGDLPKYEWKLHDEFKNIGRYKCQKATYTRIRESKRFTFDTEKGNKEETVMDTINYTAWYTPDIPISNGPDSYWGLPGLIMEISDGRTNMICSKLTLNPKEGVTIEKPTKGKKITQNEFEEIRDKKMEEMTQQYQGNGENRVIIRTN